MTASLHPFRPLSAPEIVSARLDAPTKKKCGWLDRVFQSAAGLTAVFEEVPTLFKVQQKKEIITDLEQLVGVFLIFLVYNSFKSDSPL